jgi:hypothetical protein
MREPAPEQPRPASHGRLFDRDVIALLGFGRRDVANGLQQPAIVEPINPGQRRDLNGLEAWPRPRR